MKVVQINATCGVGSTGKICVGISERLTARGIENYILYSSKTNGYPLGISCAAELYIKAQALKSRFFGNYGFNSNKATHSIIAELERIQPDIVHLHNIHGHDCNLETLFGYFREKKTKLIWTFHDCWAFTAYCPHFTMAKCSKWKKHCTQCAQKSDFSWFFDRSRHLFSKKKELFSGLDLTIITPSHWLKDLVKESFLGPYPVRVINNGIDLSVFYPRKSDFRQKYDIGDKYIVLGVAFGWGKRKGLDVFIDLAHTLPEAYQIVLVGTDDQTDKLLPANIISIHRTQNQQELAEIYSAADVFVNPTREENFPTVNIEALACGSPVVTFCTGGSPEIIDDACGMTVPCDNTAKLAKKIQQVCTEKMFSPEACINRANLFDMQDRFEEYILLYKELSE